MSGTVLLAGGPAVELYYRGTLALLPEIALALGVVALLLWEAFRRETAGLGKRAGYAAIAVLAVALLLSAVAPAEKQTLYSGMLVLDPFTKYFRILSCAAGILGVATALHSSEIADRRAGEYYAMFLALVVGMILMAAASDLLMIYIAIELVSFMSYVLAGFRRKDRRSAEAALKYVIYGGAASGVMLFGFSLIYGLTHETQLSVLTSRVAARGRDAGLTAALGHGAAIPLALTAGLVLSFAGFAYKIAAVPLHMWSPDVYEGAPTPFTAFLSTGPKAAGFAALLRFFVVGFAEPGHYANSHLLAEVTRLPWPTLIVIVSLFTMTVGNLAAIGQSNIKRFLAYSSIAHAGYSLIGIAAFSRTGAAAVLLYMAFYLLMNIGAFFAVVWVKERAGTEQIDGYRGLGYRAPFIALAFTICLFSLTGLPPLAGFIGKFYLFSAALDRGSAYPVIAGCEPGLRASLGVVEAIGCSVRGGAMFYWLALLGALNSAVSLYYYARVVRRMYLDRPEDPAPLLEDRPAKVILGTIAVALVVGGIYWAPLWNAAERAIDFQRPSLAEIEDRATPSFVDVEQPRSHATASLDGSAAQP